MSAEVPIGSDLQVQRTELNDDYAERFRADLTTHGLLDAMPPELRERLLPGADRV